ncbi:MAG: CapA family protein, partial [Alloprevotella sp.]|nr:CapA family protein [Alloprevotella sp.]
TTYPSVQLPANGGRDLFRDAAPVLQRADVACGNLEGAMADGGASTKRGGANSYSFRMPTSYAPLLTEAGFDFLSLANNHANDFGPAGIASTERCLQEQGIGFAGIKGHPETSVKEIGGVRYGFCAFGHNRYTLRTQETAEVQRIVRGLRSQCDILIVSFHGGAEGARFKHLPNGTETFLGEDRGDLRRFARTCIDAGADLVYGHGPHVVRAIDLYKGKFIAYSLGNFCTPYGISVNGVNAYSPIIEVKIDGRGNFLEGQIHSLVQARGIGPRTDAANGPAREIKALTEADVPQAALSIGADGRIVRK